MMKRISKFLLLPIILIIFISSINVYGLDEFIDNYTNEDYIASKYNVIRNSTYNCMELEYSSFNKIYVNFSDGWIESDALNHLSHNDTYSKWNPILRTDDNIYFYKDYGVDYFENFTHEFDVNIDVISKSSTQFNRFVLYCLANGIGDWRDFFSSGTECLFLMIGAKDTDPLDYTIAVSFRNATGSYNIKSTSGFNNSQTYYLRFVKNEINVYLEIYKDEFRTDLVENITNNYMKTNYKYRYAYTPQSIDSATAYESYGWLRNLWIGDSIGGYETQGYFYTEQLLNYANGSTVVLLTNSSSNTGNIRVQFSNDNSTWVNHNGVVGNYEGLKDGFESIDLRDLNYTQVYMRFNFTRGDGDKTPRLRQIRLITSGTGAGPGPGPGPSGGGGVGFVIGILILLPIAILIIGVWKKK